jgi:hypothetical protein
MSYSSIHQFGGETEEEEIAWLQKLGDKRTPAQENRLDYLLDRYGGGGYRKRKLLRSKKYKKSKRHKKRTRRRQRHISNN